MDTKFVYLVRAGKYYKIGVARKLKDRVKTLQTSNPEKVSVIIAALFKDYGKIEKDLHTCFFGKNMIGEWFELTGEDLRFIVNVISFLHFSQLRDFDRGTSWEKAMKNVVHEGEIFGAL